LPDLRRRSAHWKRHGERFLVAIEETHGNPAKLRDPAFAQILAKLDYFKLSENLRCILFNYGQKRSGRTNADFNGPC
jgi:hypothetical protein